MSLKKILNSIHLLDDDSEEEMNLNFEKSRTSNKKLLAKKEKLLDKKELDNTEINFEIIKNEKKEKSVKISINLNLEETNEIVSLEFNINKKIFLKIASDLNKK
jgi:hypothetical protein